MNSKKLIFIFGLLVATTGNTFAEEAKSPWKSSAELGYVSTSGNTNTETIKSSFDISYEIEKWLHKGHAEAFSTTAETTDASTTPATVTDERTAAKWLVSGQSDYKFRELDYFYGLLSYEDDRFSGFQYQAKLGFGYGRKVIHTDEHELKLEIGPGYRLYRLEQAPPPALPVESENDTLARVNAGYIWKISKTSKFTEDLTGEFGADQDEYKSVTALTANINSSLAMKLSYTVKNLDVVPAGKKNTDRETSVTLVYTF